MKKFITLSLVLFSLVGFAQEENNEQQNIEPTFKRWALDVQAGVHKPTRPFTAGFTDSPGLWQGDIGVRYMLTRSFGIGLKAGYNSIESSDDSSSEFETDYYRLSLEGIVNLGNFVDLKDTSSKFGILGHGGIGVGFLPIESIDDTDHHLNFTVGITPQYRIADNFSLYADLTLVGTTRNHYGWDGVRIPGEDVRGFEGLLINTSLGLTYYFGNGSEPADFANDPIDDIVANLSDELATLARENADDDQDGVPNYLDRDNTTESGVRVDRKGRALDLNKNGIPDDMESALDGRYASKGDLSKINNNSSNNNLSLSNDEIIKRLINEGYVNVYFQFNSTKPTTYSLDAVNTIVTYMKDNPSANATLTGYADELGNLSYNKTLSERRAKMVYDVLVASGIAPSRLSHNGNGEDASVDRNSEQARQLVRRVTFRVH